MMPNELVIIEPGGPPGRRAEDLPALVTRAGGAAAQAWTDFFDGKVRNAHTRKAYGRSVRHFLAWADAQGLELPHIMAGDVGRRHARVYTDMENWAEIRRRVLVDGLSKRAACREYDIHWLTRSRRSSTTRSRPAIAAPSPAPATPSLEPLLPVVHQILEDDKKAPKKQRHTAAGSSSGSATSTATPAA
jgi:hypothetical protein